jgi:hypothetical protein
MLLLKVIQRITGIGQIPVVWASSTVAVIKAGGISIL